MMMMMEEGTETATPIMKRRRVDGKEESSGQQQQPELLEGFLSFEYFVLDQVSEALVLLSLTLDEERSSSSNSIPNSSVACLFANKTFGSLVKSNLVRPTSIPFASSSQCQAFYQEMAKLVDKIGDCRGGERGHEVGRTEDSDVCLRKSSYGPLNVLEHKTCIDVTLVSTEDSQQSILTRCWITLFPHPHQTQTTGNTSYYFSCRFVQIVQQPSDRNEKLCLLLQRLGDFSASICEYDREKKDILNLFNTAKYNRDFGTTTTDISNKWELEDLYRSRDSVIESISEFEKILKQEQQQAEQCYSFLQQESGNKRCWQVHIIYLGDSNTGRPQFLRVYQETTEMTKIETQIDNTMFILQQLFSTSPVFMEVIEVTEDGGDWDTLLANPSVVKYMGRNPIGLRYSALRSNYPERKVICEKIQECRSCQQAIQFDVEMENFGDISHMNILLLHIRDRVFLYLGQDITSSKRTEKDLESLVLQRTEELQRVVEKNSKFLSTISHEIRTPLGTILGICSLLEDDPNLTSDQQQWVQTAQTCGKQLLVLLNDILDFQKLSSKKVTLESLPFAFHSLVESSLDIVSIEAEKKNLELVCDLSCTGWEEGEDTVIGDPGRFRQILVNLLSNAVKFSMEGGEVLVSVKTNPLETSANTDDSSLTEIEVSVRDNGVGIPEEVKNSLFQEFCQANAAVTRNHGGSGLGLWICKHLCELMRGKIWVDSSTDGPQKGSTFTFKVVLQKSSPIATPIGNSVPTSDSVHARKEIMTHLHQLHQHRCPAPAVLIIGPNTIALRILDQRLSHLGFRVTQDPAPDDQLLKSADFVFVDLRIEVKYVTYLKEKITNFKTTHFILMGHTPPREPLLKDTSFLKKPVKTSAFYCDLANHLVNYIEKGCVKCQLLQQEQGPRTPSDLGVQKKEGTINSSFSLKSLPTCPITPRPATILLAEDNALNSTIIVKILHRLGYHNVEIAKDGLQVLQMYEKKSYDIILMDVNMPEKDGLQTTLELRRKYALGPPYIIALTGNTLEEDRKQCFSVGMQQVLAKPVDRTSLDQTLSNAISELHLLK